MGGCYEGEGWGEDGVSNLIFRDQLSRMMAVGCEGLTFIADGDCEWGVVAGDGGSFLAMMCV